jgi:hypothetical protein
VTPWYIATKKFGPESGENWEKYIAWSGLHQLVELVSLDDMLCPSVLREIRDEYWPYIVNENFLLGYFTDFPFLMSQVESIEPKNVLCVFREPSQLPRAPEGEPFRFEGYDLVDLKFGVSALTNCGGSPEAFSNEELNAVGLLSTFERAVEVQQRLRELFPDEPHADCDLWAIFRMVGASGS